MRMKYRRIRPAAYAISLCPFSSSTSNIAFGRAWETPASMTPACSFWSPSSRSVLRPFSGRRGPRRWLLFCPKSRESLLGPDFSGAPRLDGRGEIGRHSVHKREPAQRFHPALAFLAYNAGYQIDATVHVAVDRHLEPGPETDLDHLRRHPDRLVSLGVGGGLVAGVRHAVRFRHRHVCALDTQQAAQLRQRLGCIFDPQIDEPIDPGATGSGRRPHHPGRRLTAPRIPPPALSLFHGGPHPPGDPRSSRHAG